MESATECQRLNLSQHSFYSGMLLQGVNLEKGHIKVDEYQNTSASQIYALGDVCGRALLTPGKYPLPSTGCLSFTCQLKWLPPVSNWLVKPDHSQSISFQANCFILN